MAEKKLAGLDELYAMRHRIESPGLLSYAVTAVDPGNITQELAGSIKHALAVPGPAGDPAAVEAQARQCKQAANQYEQAADDIGVVAHGHLPSVWQGATAEMASRAIAEAGTRVRQLQHPLEQAAEALTRWADELGEAQSRDRTGIARLRDALAMVERDGFVAQVLDENSAARTLAGDGVTDRIHAAERARDQAKEIGDTLGKLAGEFSARAQQVHSPGNDGLTSAQLASLKDQNGTLLTKTQIARANARLESMSAADQAAFDRMLANSQSKLQAGYLWQALGAGHSMTELQSFNAAIQGYDDSWLTQHLTPDMSSDSYKGISFSQGDTPDCVAASTVIAQAKADPAYMLSLTTGGRANGDDSGSAFQDRLQREYLNQYDQAQEADGTVNPNGGIGPRGETSLANHDLGAVTDSHYQYQHMDSSGARASALGQINQAVDSGKPVPVDVTDGANGHQMMIIGRSGDRLQIYNPWGSTGWVTDSQFVNGQLGSLTNYSVPGGATPGGLPTPNAVELPQ